MHNCHHIILLTYYSTYGLWTTITRFIAVNKIVYQQVRRVIRLPSDNSWARRDVVWIIWAGDHDKLSCPHLNGEWQFHAKSYDLICAFLACPTDWARGPPLLCDECAVVALLPDNRIRLADSLQQTVNDCNFPTVVRKFTLASFVHHTALTDRDFKSKSHIPMNFSWF